MKIKGKIRFDPLLLAIYNALYL